EEHDRMVELVRAKRNTAGKQQVLRILQRRVRFDPAQVLEWRCRESRLGVILRLEPVLHHLELQRPDGCKERRTWRRVPDREGLDNTFLQELLETRAVTLRIRGTRVAQIGEYLRREARDLVEANGAVLCKGVANTERVVADETDHVARPGLVHGLAFLTEEFVRGRQPDRAPGTLVHHGHVAL